jgi:hypothetical protein
MTIGIDMSDIFVAIAVSMLGGCDQLYVVEETYQFGGYP